jgi:2-polyprenyl-3-methyl-5-hydroxy-6-metoxy-1,4-benzoquinol methylase
MVEQSPRLLNAAPAYIGPDCARAKPLLIGLQVNTVHTKNAEEKISLNRFVNISFGHYLKSFNPEPGSYDCIWIQWVIGHLPDLDYISFFRRCARGLRPGGVIILKDNCAKGWTFIVDKDDNSVARCRDYHKLLFDLAGLEIVLEKTQTKFTKELLISLQKKD